MPRIQAPVFVTNTTAKAGDVTLPMEQIPEEIRQEVEEIYAGLKANPQGRIRVGFDTVEELKQYELQVKSYCAIRPEGAIRFRRSPTRNLPDTYMDFRITDLPEAPEPVSPPVVPGSVTPVKTAGRKR